MSMKVQQEEDDPSKDQDDTALVPTQDEKQGPVQYDNANLFLQLFFLWHLPHFRKPGKVWADINNLLRLPKVFSHETYLPAFEKHWQDELKSNKPSFLRAMFKTFKKQYFVVVTIKLIDAWAQLWFAVVIAQLVDNVSNNGSQFDAYMYVLALFCLMLIVNLWHNNGFNYGLAVCGTAKNLLVAIVHKYSLKLRVNNSQGSSMTGKLIAIAATDAEYYDMAFLTTFIVISPLAYIGGGIILYIYIGPSAFVALGIVLTYIMILRINVGGIKKLRLNVGKNTDQKLKTLNSLIEAIRVVKMYTWEMRFRDLIKSFRDKEISNERKLAMLISIFLTLFITGHGVVAFMTIGTYVWLGNELTASTAFAAISILYSMQMIAVGQLSYGIEIASMLAAGGNRITNVLTSEQFDEDYASEPSPGYVLELENLRSWWSRSTDQVAKPSLKRTRNSNDMTFDTLVDISMKIKPGQLVAVVGPVGSGKSSLLASILGEMYIKSGEIKISKKVSYVEQEPWIIGASIRENILMNNSFDHSRYEQVIQACSLVSDFNTLTHGDETIVGDRGINLSGGQKARIALARSAYSDSDLYLLDDPLSAVDTNVRLQLFNNCIKGLLQNKSCILVTHQLHVLNAVDYVICLDKGLVVAEGTYEEIQESEAFQEICEIERHDEEEQRHVQVSPDTITESKDKDQKTIVDEEHFVGSVPYSVYYRYFEYGGIFALIGILLFYILVQVNFLAIPYWLTVWVKADDQQDSFYTIVFAFLAFGLLILNWTRATITQQYILSCNSNMHTHMLNTVVRAPVTFFDANPAGRVINRFSKDTMLTDSMLKKLLTESTQFFFVVIGNFIVMIIINPFIAPVIAVLLVAIVFVYRFTTPAIVESKRTELKAKSPVFNSYASSLNGIMTIRAYKFSEWVIKSMRDNILTSTRAIFTVQTFLRAYVFYVDIIMTLLINMNALIIISLKDSFDSELVGLSLSFTSNMAMAILWFVKSMVEAGTFMAAAQRMMDYTKLESEAEIQTEEGLTITNGRIQFENVSMRYRKHLDPALINLSLDIDAGMKVGVVGRTGAGKSTILQTLFRLIEMHEGRILIDDQDVRSVGLHDLRKQISVIPQDPFIFPATVKQNLDPFNEYTEEDLWSALSEVELNDFFQFLPNKLDTVLVMSEYSLSVGQKQLMCLARAILRKNKILVLDEATANIDLQTDQIIQAKIRERFSDCTVISIAHRINTIIDSDKVIVMDKGQAVEFDTPRELVKRQGHFKGLIDALGELEAASLLSQIK